MTFSRLIQLTDLHLYADNSFCMNGVNPAKSFNIVLQQAVKMQPHYITITGDIAMDESLEVYEWVTEVMRGTGIPWSWLPGNHDDVLFMQKKFVREVICGSWRLIHLNSRIEGKGWGALSDEELKLLKCIIENDSKVPTLVMVHHHVDNTGSFLDDGRIDSKEFFRIIGSHLCIKAVVHGHIHQEWENQHGHITTLGTPSTSVQFQPEAEYFLLDKTAWPGFRVFDLYNDGKWRSKVCRVKGAGLKVNSEIPHF